MCAKVPSHLKEPLLKELRRERLRSAFKHYPALVLIFSSVSALAVLVKEHAIVRLVRDIVPSFVSDGTLVAIVLAVIVLVTAVVLIYFLRQQCKECECQDCLYCPECDAVDKYDSGECPICHRRLHLTESFYCTTYKDEQKIIEKWRLPASREG